MDCRAVRRYPARRRRDTARARQALLGLALGAAIATMLATPAGAAWPQRLTLWSRCSLNVKVASVEVTPVEVLHLTCSQAKQALRRAHILQTPGGPIFSTHGYRCRSKNILPRIDPSPVQLPAAESCTDAGHGQLSFIWNYAS